MTNSYGHDLAGILRRQRISIPLTLRELSCKSGVSSSHLGRMERGERLPSGRILRKVAAALNLEEDYLLTVAGYRSPPSADELEHGQGHQVMALDPYIARMLAQEPVEVQHTIIGILSILKSVARGMGERVQH